MKRFSVSVPMEETNEMTPNNVPADPLMQLTSIWQTSVTHIHCIYVGQPAAPYDTKSDLLLFIVNKILNLNANSKKFIEEM